LPDIEGSFWRKYKDKGLVVVGVNPGGRGGTRGGASTDDVAGVQRYTQNLQVTYPIGLEMTKNYVPFAAAFKGLNPFPVDVVVGKDGRIAYVSREYDLAGIRAAIERELAKR
jgi:hypothetical protein